jgi:S-adenosylmethionine synthetase
LSIYIDTYGTATGGRSDADVLAIVEKNFDLRPGTLLLLLSTIACF